MLNSNLITFPCGTTGDFEIIPYLDNIEEPYILQDNDKIIFTAKSNPYAQKIQLQKTLTKKDYTDDNNLILHFAPEDTANMQPFDYHYDCGLQFADGSFYIFIEDSILRLIPSISKKISSTNTDTDTDADNTDDSNTDDGNVNDSNADNENGGDENIDSGT